MERKPENISQYKRWLRKIHKTTIDERYQTYYESVASKVKQDLEASEFWIQLRNNIASYDQEYQLKFGYPLFTPGFEPEILTKSFESFLLKTFRKNILENTLWPSEPKNGWLLPSNWFSQINDIVRTLFVVKYLDGVEFMKERIESLCMQLKTGCEVSFEAREEGYYAGHLYIQQSFEIPQISWDTEIVNISFEIQITTQLQEVIRKLLHKYYEKRRKRVFKSVEKWQWNYRSEEFSANYLGHILHYVEGMIMDIREKQQEGKK